ncbi:hypothetical protein ALT1644_30067 [Alteromonas macleodii]
MPWRSTIAENTQKQNLKIKLLDDNQQLTKQEHSLLLRKYNVQRFISSLLQVQQIRKGGRVCVHQ